MAKPSQHFADLGDSPVHLYKNHSPSMKFLHCSLATLPVCSRVMMAVKFIRFPLNANYQCLKSDILSTLKTEHHPLMSAEKPEDWTLDFAEPDS